MFQKKQLNFKFSWCILNQLNSYESFICISLYTMKQSKMCSIWIKMRARPDQNWMQKEKYFVGNRAIQRLLLHLKSAASFKNTGLKKKGIKLLIYLSSKVLFKFFEKNVSLSCAKNSIKYSYCYIVVHYIYILLLLFLFQWKVTTVLS